LKEVRGFVKFFTGFLAAIAALLGVRYPILPEKLLPIYQVDYSQAVNLVCLLSAAALITGATAFACGRLKARSPKEEQAPLSSMLLAGAGTLLIVVFALGCIRTFRLVHLSTRIAGAKMVAASRERTDIYARDTVLMLENDTLDTSRRYDRATEFLAAEGIEPPSNEQLLQSVKRPPLQDEIVTAYVTATSCFKFGLFLMAVAIYIRQKKKQPASRSRKST
jgi:hypothetical protein